MFDIVDERHMMVQTGWDDELLVDKGHPKRHGAGARAFDDHPYIAHFLECT